MEEILTPQYRIEDFLVAIANGESCPHTPIYRHELYLAYLCGADVSVPQPIYRTEQYLAYKCGLDVELPQPIYRQEMFLAKWCGMDIELPEPIYRIEWFLEQLSKGYLITKTGNPISVSDALAKPAESLTIEILPQQDLHGYANPWPAGGGVNKFDLATSFTEGQTIQLNGIKAVFSNGMMHITGSNELGSSFNLWNLPISGTLPAGTYISPHHKLFIRCSVDGGSNTNYQNSFTATQSVSLVSFYFVISAGDTNLDLTIPMMIVSGTTRPTTYAPYSNICPISGHDSVKVTRTGKNVLDMTNAKLGSWNKWDIPNTLKPNTTYTYSVSNASYAYGLFMTHNHTETGDRVTVRLVGYIGDGFATFTTPANIGDYPWLILGGSSGDAGHADANFQVELGSTATAYEPYQGETYTIQLGQTVYGGTLDVTSGVLTVDRAYALLNNPDKWILTSGTADLRYDVPIEDRKTYNDSYSGLMCSYVPCVYGAEPYGRWNASNGYYFCIKSSAITLDQVKADASAGKIAIAYELATPITIQLTPTEVQMLLGDNTIWNDVGDMTLEYLADGPADDSDALMILLGNRYVNNGEPDEATDREALEILLGGNTR